MASAAPLHCHLLKQEKLKETPVRGVKRHHTEEGKRLKGKSPALLAIGSA